MLAPYMLYSFVTEANIDRAAIYSIGALACVKSQKLKNSHATEKRRMANFKRYCNMTLYNRITLSQSVRDNMLLYIYKIDAKPAIDLVKNEPP